MRRFQENEQMALNAAEGWLMLGCPAEAELELKAIRPENFNKSEVLSLRWSLNYRKKWVCSRICGWEDEESQETWTAERRELRLESRRSAAFNWRASFRICRGVLKGEASPAYTRKRKVVGRC